MKGLMLIHPPRLPRWFHHPETGQSVSPSKSETIGLVLSGGSKHKAKYRTNEQKRTFFKKKGISLCSNQLLSRKNHQNPSKLKQVQTNQSLFPGFVLIRAALFNCRTFFPAPASQWPRPQRSCGQREVKGSARSRRSPVGVTAAAVAAVAMAAL